VTVATQNEPRGAFRSGAARLFDVGDDRSLDDAVATAWGSLALRGSASCLVCGTTVTGREDSQSAACPGCGATLE
jgi:rubrerythrin